MSSQTERLPLYLFARAASFCVAAIVLVAVFLHVLLWMIVYSLPPLDLRRSERLSSVVLASDGRILKSYLASDGVWRLPASTADVPSNYLQMLLAYEDKRFYQHSGIDFIAVGRAAYQFIRYQDIVSGASTLSMQVVRLVGGRERGFLGKIRQALLAMRLEQQLNKQQILSLYLTLAPYGGNIEGIRAASIHYFGHEPNRLSAGEAALLVVLPQSPERRRPRAGEVAARTARNRLIEALGRRGVLSSDVAARALQEQVPFDRSRLSQIAHHFSDRMRADDPSALVIRSLIDRDLQTKVEELARQLVDREIDGANVAVLVVRRHDMAVRAYVGGGAYFRADRAGMVDLVRAIRSPGSTLKPVIFALAFEERIIHPETVVTDDIIRFHGYAPENFDRTYRGELTAHDALVQSLNTVPVLLLQQLGPDAFLRRLRSAGISIELADPGSPPGLAIALGGLGINLENLAKIYLGVANGGSVEPLRFLVAAGTASSKRLTSKEAAWAVTNILADGSPAKGRAALVSKDGGRRVAYKTGTSYGFRDAWAVGYDREFLVAIWIGRPDGNSRPGQTGASAAVPLMQEIFDLLPVPALDVASDRPANRDLARTAILPDRLRRLPMLGLHDRSGQERSLQIRFPIDGSVVQLQKDERSANLIGLSATGGRPPYLWYVDGQPLTNNPSDGEIAWTPEGRGQVEFSVVDSAGRHAVAKVWFD